MPEQDITVERQPSPTPEVPAIVPKETMTDDGNIVERDGVKYVRMEALANEREARQRLSNTLRQLEPVLPEFNEFLESKRNRNNAAVSRATESDEDYTDDDLKGLAITRGYYKDDNTTPDTDRAKQELAILSRVADRRAAKHVKPVAERTTRDQADVNRERARNTKFVDGEPVAEQKYIDLAFQALPDTIAADPNVANLVQVLAAGLQSLDDRKSGRSRRRHEPMHVEGGGRFDGDDGSTSDLDLYAAKARGKTPEQWNKLSKKIETGKTFILEDLQ